MTHPTPDLPLLRFTDFRKRYGDFLVLETEALTLDPGIHLLIGPNGAGKTTLLKALSGMIDFEGSIWLEELLIKKERIRHRQRVNYCEAEPVFAPFLSGEQLVDLYSRAKQGSPAQVAHLREVLGITDYLGQQVGAYSSGMKKKLALLLAFLGEPHLILLDEPLTTLDPQTQPQLVELIREQVAAGVSFILSSHQPIGLDDLEVRSSLLIQDRQIRSVAGEELGEWFGLHETKEKP